MSDCKMIRLSIGDAQQILTALDVAANEEIAEAERCERYAEWPSEADDAERWREFAWDCRARSAEYRRICKFIQGEVWGREQDN